MHLLEVVADQQPISCIILLKFLETEEMAVTDAGCFSWWSLRIRKEDTSGLISSKFPLLGAGQ